MQVKNGYYLFLTLVKRGSYQAPIQLTSGFNFQLLLFIQNDSAEFLFQGEYHGSDCK